MTSWGQKLRGYVSPPLPCSVMLRDILVLACVFIPLSFSVSSTLLPSRKSYWPHCSVYILVLHTGFQPLDSSSASSSGWKYVFLLGTSLPFYAGCSSAFCSVLSGTETLTSPRPSYLTPSTGSSTESHLSLQLPRCLFFSTIKCDHRTNLI